MRIQGLAMTKTKGVKDNAKQLVPGNVNQQSKYIDKFKEMRLFFRINVLFVKGIRIN